MGYLKQQASGIPAMVMGAVFVLIGLGGLAWLIWSLGAAVHGPKEGSAFALLVFFALILSPACLIIGVLAFLGGFRKSYPTGPGR